MKKPLFDINNFWYSRHPLRWLLIPFSAMYWFVSVVRRVYLQQIKQVQASVPVIVVGNLTVGGVGKTPLVIALVKSLQDKGLRVGVVSRGYGARGPFPRAVRDDDNALDVGDEPLMIAKRAACPIVIAPKRVDAVKYLITHFDPQIIISDDGLQHYAMGRSLEIAVIDGARGLGNGLLCPAGPLRERASRLKSVDFVVVNGGAWPNAYSMDMVCGEITALLTGKTIKPDDLNKTVAAVAAIGNPERFFATLRELNISFNPHSFLDHHRFLPHDLAFEETEIVMTEKDAVKCLPFATANMYFLPVTAKLGTDFWDALWKHKQLKKVVSV